MKSLRVPIVLVLGLAVLLAGGLGCASGASGQRKAYTTIDNAVTGVQAAVSAYKRHCGVPKGGEGPGTCNATEYTRAEAVYAQFQDTALNAVDLAEKTGQTPLQVVTSAAATVLELVEKWRQ